MKLHENIEDFRRLIILLESKKIVLGLKNQHYFYAIHLNARNFTRESLRKSIITH